jgi:tRNA threonylcarbamoyladenosine biosynthesis protein TsaE
MKPGIYQTASAEETVALGRRLALELPRPACVLLIGNLGAGKTTLAKGLVAGLEAAREDDVSSPTFPLIHEYGEPVEVYHVDLYRLETREEVERLGLAEILDRPAITLLEWAERFPELLPLPRWEVTISPTGGENEDARQVEVLLLE